MRDVGLLCFSKNLTFETCYTYMMMEVADMCFLQYCTPFNLFILQV